MSRSVVLLRDAAIKAVGDAFAGLDRNVTNPFKPTGFTLMTMDKNGVIEHRFIGANFDEALATLKAMAEGIEPAEPKLPDLTPRPRIEAPEAHRRRRQRAQA